jgi:NADH-quinone oxidoreductase subunit I
MYCGICVEACPFDALFWAPAYDYPADDADGLVHEKGQLTSWLPEVPEPPPLVQTAIATRPPSRRTLRSSP